MKPTDIVAHESQNCGGRFGRSTLTQWAAPAAAGVIALLSAPAPAAACQLVRLAELDATLQNNTPLVPATIDSRSVEMILDTAFTRTQLSRSAAKDLNLKLQPSTVKYEGPGGVDVADMTNVRDFTFAGATTHRVPLYVTGQVASTGNAVGAIGEDEISHFDIEFDLGSGKIRFFAPVDCRGDQVAYWTREYFVANLAHTSETDRPLVEVMLNGQKVLAALSSGIPQSTVTAQALRLSGVKPESATDSSFVVVPSITIGQETLENAKLRVAAPDGRYGVARAESQLDHHAFLEPDLEIGGDFFLAHRIYLSRSQKKVYFTYNGGPGSRTAGISSLRRDAGR